MQGLRPGTSDGMTGISCVGTVAAPAARAARAFDAARKLAVGDGLAEADRGDRLR
jgi:hypothetical protein